MGFLRKQRGVPFVRRAPTKGGDDVPIHVAKMTVPHVLWWHSHVQPIIDRDPSRADNGWNWLLYVPFAEVAGRVLTRRPAGYTIGISDRERDRFVPCALVQLLGRVPALDDHDRESVFVWFLSTAPDEALTTIEDQFADELPKLPVLTIEQVLHDLLERDGTAAEREIVPIYPKRAPLPSLGSSPPALPPLLAEQWRTLLARLLRRLRRL